MLKELHEISTIRTNFPPRNIKTLSGKNNGHNCHYTGRERKDTQHHMPLRCTFERFTAVMYGKSAANCQDQEQKAGY